MASLRYISWYQRLVRSFTMETRRNPKVNYVMIEEDRYDEYTMLRRQIDLLTQQMAVMVARQPEPAPHLEHHCLRISWRIRLYR